MQKLCQRESNAWAYYFRFQKIVGVSYYRVILSVHYILRHREVPLHYFTSWQGHSNDLLSDPNRDHMQKLCPRELEVETYHFGVNKFVGISHPRFIFGVKCFLRNGVGHFRISHLGGTFHTISQVTQMKILCEIYTYGKMCTNLQLWGS